MLKYTMGDKGVIIILMILQIVTLPLSAEAVGYLIKFKFPLNWA